MKSFNSFKRFLSESINDLANEFFYKIRKSADIAHHIHLNSDSYSQHMALDEYYNGIIGLLDKYMENFIGRYGKLSDYEEYENKFDTEDPIKLLHDVRYYIDQERSELGTQSELQNLIDEILGLLNSTIYKLENLK